MQSIMMRVLWIVWVLVCCVPLPAQDAVSAPAPREVLIFKSGQAYVYREVDDLSDDASRVRLRMPTGVHGTVWLGSDGFDVLGAQASLEEEWTEHPVRGLQDTLRMAVGRQVTIKASAGQETEVYAGVVERLLERVPDQPAGEETVPGAPDSIVIRSTNGSQAVVPAVRIVGITFTKGEADLPWRYRAPVRAPILDVALKPRSEGARTVALASMADGMAWMPSYVLHLQQDGRARLVGKAVVMNDLEDLRQTRVRLVVGYPNIQFSGVRSALLPEVTLAAFRSMLGGVGASGVMSNPMSQVMMNVASFDMGRSTSGPTTPAPGEAEEDLYIYDGGTLDLERGQRAYIPLFSADVPFAHRYDWDLEDRVDAHARFVQTSPEPTPLWHVLLVRNTTKAPWTTAPILIHGAKGPLAQSQVTYTPVGREAIVRLTKALNLVGESVEYRTDDATSTREEVYLFGNRYELIAVKGQLNITNHSDRAAPIKVTKSLSGDVTSHTGDPVIRGRTKGLGQVNASRDLEWTVTVDPGQTWEATYEYRVLIRR